MKKLRLDLDNIQVERFEPGSAEGDKGTVEGLQYYTVNGTCPPVESCNTNMYQRCRCQ
ncbi:MAG TPA: hypothetical protein VGX50_03075 [Longimicrobium sp.]|jgi:hypothetical protein|nr:hypothetical protein [Longimicrobium sp.]